MGVQPTAIVYTTAGGTQRTAASTARPTLTVRAVLALTSQPLKGLDVRTCAEAPCNIPFSGGTTDENGVTKLSSWGSAVTISGSSSDSYLTYPLNVFTVSTSATTLDAEVYNDVALVEAAQLAAVPHVDGMGTVTTRVVDCAGAPAAGVAMLLPGADERTVSLYHEGDQQLATGHGETGVSGRAMVLNVRAGHFVLFAQDLRTGRQVATFSGYVPPNGVAHAELGPGVAK